MVMFDDSKKFLMSLMRRINKKLVKEMDSEKYQEFIESMVGLG